MKAYLIAALLLSSMTFISTQYAQARPGVTGHVEDDRKQFVDFTANDDGTITFKVSNGRQLRPMWVVVHTDYFSPSGAFLGRLDYHVFCPAPSLGGGGQERSFTFAAPNVGDFASVLMHSNKEHPWSAPGTGWITPIGGYPEMPSAPPIFKTPRLPIH